jgi:protein-tyrosine phosphatase
MVEARAGYMGAALDVIDTEWGGIEAYLDQAVGFGPAQRMQLQALLLE